MTVENRVVRTAFARITVLLLILQVIGFSPTMSSACSLGPFSRLEYVTLQVSSFDGLASYTKSGIEEDQVDEACGPGTHLTYSGDNTFVFDEKILYDVIKDGNQVELVNDREPNMGTFYYRHSNSVGKIGNAPVYFSWLYNSRYTTIKDSLSLRYGENVVNLNLMAYGDQLEMDNNLTSSKTIGLGFQDEKVLVAFGLSNATHYRIVVMDNEVVSNSTQYTYLDFKNKDDPDILGKLYGIVTLDNLLVSIDVSGGFQTLRYDLETLEMSDLGNSLQLHIAFNSNLIVRGSNHLTVVDGSGHITVHRYDYETLDEIGEGYVDKVDYDNFLVLEDFIVEVKWDEPGFPWWILLPGGFLILVVVAKLIDRRKHKLWLRDNYNMEVPQKREKFDHPEYDT